MRSLPLPVRVLPLCSVVWLMAAQDSCTIHVVDDGEEGEGEQCADLADFCPDLVCDAYATGDDGCPICECAPAEGEGEGEVGCESDADCAPGQICVFGDALPPNDPVPCFPDDNGGCQSDPPAGGTCVDVGGGCELVDCAPGFICVEDNGQATCVFNDDGLCQSDADCGDGEQCNTWDYCINPDCFDSPDGACEPVCTHGLCEPVQQNDTCTSDADCGDGFHCEFGVTGAEDRPCNPDDPNCGAIAPAPEGICVANSSGCFSDADCGIGYSCVFPDGTDPNGSGDAPDFCDPSSPECGGTPAPPAEGQCVWTGGNGECSDDSQCGDGYHCELRCEQDPSCPECDSCLVVGSCVADDQCAALCGPGSQCVINDDGSMSCVVIDPPPAPDCTSDADCGEGSTCSVNNGDCAQNPSCEPNGACTDECWGWCSEPQAPSCQSDADCAEGQICADVGSCGPGFIACFQDLRCVTP